VNVVAIDQFAAAVRALSFACFFGAGFACFIGALLGSLSGRGVLLFLFRRCRTWRRFARAFDRVVWGVK